MYFDTFINDHYQRYVGSSNMVEPHTVVLECNKCEYRWDSKAAGKRVTCPSCGYKTDRNKVGEQIFVRGKWLYTDDENLDDMIESTRERLELLETLKKDGYKVTNAETLADDYCYLWNLNEDTDKSELERSSE